MPIQTSFAAIQLNPQFPLQMTVLNRTDTQNLEVLSPGGNIPPAPQASAAAAPTVVFKSPVTPAAKTVLENFLTASQVQDNFDNIVTPGLALLTEGIEAVGLKPFSNGDYIIQTSKVRVKDVKFSSKTSSHKLGLAVDVAVTGGYAGAKTLLDLVIKNNGTYNLLAQIIFENTKMQPNTYHIHLDFLKVPGAVLSNGSDTRGIGRLYFSRADMERNPLNFKYDANNEKVPLYYRFAGNGSNWSGRLAVYNIPGKEFFEYV